MPQTEPSTDPRRVAVLADLAAEQADLRAIVAAIDESAWSTPTPSEGWDVRDQIGHLAFFDGRARLAATDPDAFVAERDEAMGSAVGMAAFMEGSLGRARASTGAELLRWWDDERDGLVAALAAVPDGVKIPWYGPPMSPTSKATARIMETWAHGQDVADALGVERTPTARLKNVAHIGVITRGFAFGANGRPAPTADVHVRLDPPDGSDPWTWGDPAADDRVEGPAIDFCLLATQRRHRDDLSLTATGPVADEWLDIIQAFAGPPGGGRAPLSPKALPT